MVFMQTVNRRWPQALILGLGTVMVWFLAARPPGALAASGRTSAGPPTPAEKYLLDNQPVVPIETPAVNWLKKPYVKGMYPNAQALFAWKFVYIERDSSKWDYGTPSLAD